MANKALVLLETKAVVSCYLDIPFSYLWLNTYYPISKNTYDGMLTYKAKQISLLLISELDKNIDQACIRFFPLLLSL